eukprot:5876434-Ditylum_brightwellii.AAC.1
MGVMTFVNVVFGLGVLISAKWCNLTHCAMDGAGTQRCVRTCTLGGGTTLRGDTNGVMPGGGVTFGSKTGLGAMMDQGLLACGVFGESALISGAGGTVSFFCRDFCPSGSCKGCEEGVGCSQAWFD